MSLILLVNKHVIALRDKKDVTVTNPFQTILDELKAQNEQNLIEYM